MVLVMAHCITFLSRLCGGEPWDSITDKHLYFLSRLCGGEQLLAMVATAECFLSRLCGGEHKCLLSIP